MTGTESNLEPPTLDGINTVIWRADKATLLRELNRDPARTISSRLKLGASDQRLLDAMTAREQAELVEPIVEALEIGKPFRVVRIDRGDTKPTEEQAAAALKKCTITITFEF